MSTGSYVPLYHPPSAPAQRELSLHARRVVRLARGLRLPRELFGLAAWVHLDEGGTAFHLAPLVCIWGIPNNVSKYSVE